LRTARESADVEVNKRDIEQSADMGVAWFVA
jgi:hypothetical protein